MLDEKRMQKALEIFGDMHFGVEFENTFDTSDLRNTIKYAGWQLKSDGSCGSELVSPPMTWKMWISDRALMRQDISSLHVDSRCGGHVHVDWSTVYNMFTDDGVNVLRRVCIMTNKLNKNVHGYLDINRGRARGSYCKKYEGSGINLKEMLNYYREHGGTNGGRYYWINLGNIQKSSVMSRNTIEFRIFDGTDSIVTGEFNIAWAVAFLAVACVTTKDFLNGLTEKQLFNIINYTAKEGLKAVMESAYVAEAYPSLELQEA